MTDHASEHAILALERAALDRWAQGDPLGYMERCADDVTYFDDIAAQHRVDGLVALRSYLGTLVGKIPPHRYELVEPKVQVYGDLGIVTLRYHPFAPDGAAQTPWKATSVYRRADGAWKAVHAHWSMVKEP